ncbi:MAG: UDP-N-acetylmuramoyl-tripeptide--D-alanyl-D-alanine ligase [Polyangiaceae bacterium]
MTTPIPENRARFDLGEVVAATAGELLSAGVLGAGGAAVGVSTDTRALVRGAVFVALGGDSFDGHTHLEAAAAAGAVLALVERPVAAPPGMALVRVRSTLDALGALARTHARRWRALGGQRITVAITGSAGKTTTRAAVAALAEARWPGAVHATRGNLNNRVGAPLMLLGLEGHHRLTVIEVGTNQPGEIAALASVVEPDAAVLTLIAAAHVEGLGSLEGVAAEKGALFAALSPRGLAVGNADDARVRRALDAAPAGRAVSYGFAPEATYRISAREPLGLTQARLTLARGASARAGAGGSELLTPLLGEAGALASAAAVAVVEELSGQAFSGDELTRALSAAQIGGGAGRLAPRLLPDGLAIVDDSYNANPASSCASIRASAELAQADGRRLLLVLGEMRELGAHAAEGHDEVGRAAAASGAALVVAIGGEARRIAAAAAQAGMRAVFVDSAAEATPLVLAEANSRDLILVKGSRGVATERVVRALVAAREATPEPGDAAAPGASDLGRGKGAA